MNPDRTPEEEAGVQEFLAILRQGTVASDKAAKAGREALPRLVTVALGYSGQSDVVLRWLASIYNGSEAPQIELDEIRRLDWSLREDLLAVMLGCAQGNFSDVEIRHAFDAAGGQEAVDRLHAVTCNNAQVRALARLVEFARKHRESSSGKALRGLLASIVSKSEHADLNMLGYMDDELTNDVMTVLVALYGRDKGKLYVENVADALRAAGLIT